MAFGINICTRVKKEKQITTRIIAWYLYVYYVLLTAET